MPKTLTDIERDLLNHSPDVFPDPQVRFSVATRSYSAQTRSDSISVVYGRMRTMGYKVHFVDRMDESSGMRRVYFE